MKKLMLLTALAVLVVGQAWAQGAGTGASLRGSYCFNDKTGQLVDCTTGEVLVRDVTDATYGDLKSTGLSALSVLPGGTYSSDLVDLSQYSFATLILTWGTSAAADSDSVNVALRFFNKETGAWGSDDAQVASWMFTPGTHSGVAADTLFSNASEPILFAQDSVSGVRVPLPNLYLYRNTSTMLRPLNVPRPLYGLGKVRRALAPNGSAVIDLSAFCKNWSYWGMQVSNWGAKTLTNFKAVLWVSR